MLVDKITIHGPITPGDGRYIVYRDTVELTEGGSLVRFLGRKRIGDAKHPITTSQVEADLGRYGKIAGWR